MERCGFPPRRAGPEAWKFRHGAKSGRARCVRFRTQRRNPTVGTLGRGPSFELPSPPTPACSPVESLRILFSPSFPRPTPPPRRMGAFQEDKRVQGSGRGPTMATSPQPRGELLHSGPRQPHRLQHQQLTVGVLPKRTWGRSSRGGADRKRRGEYVCLSRPGEPRPCLFGPSWTFQP